MCVITNLIALTIIAIAKFFIRVKGFVDELLRINEHLRSE